MADIFACALVVVGLAVVIFGITSCVQTSNQERTKCIEMAITNKVPAPDARSMCGGLYI